MLLVDKEGKTSELKNSGPQAVLKLQDKSYTLIANHAYEGDIGPKDKLSGEGREFLVNDFELTDEQLEEKKLAKDMNAVSSKVGTFDISTDHSGWCLNHKPDMLIYRIGKSRVRLVLETPILRTGENVTGDTENDNAHKIRRFFVGPDELNWKSLNSYFDDMIHEEIVFKPFTEKDIVYKQFFTDEQKKNMRQDLAEEQEYLQDQQQELLQDQEFQKTVTEPLPKQDPNAEIVRGNNISPEKLWDMIVAEENKHKRQGFSRLCAATGKYYKPNRKNNIKLAKIFMYWTNHDYEKTDEMFRKTGQATEKWMNDANYRSQIMTAAEMQVSGGYMGSYELRHLTQDTYPKSMDELFENLDQERLKWHLAHDERDKEDGHVIKHKKMTHDDVIQILLAKEKWAIPYSDIDERENPNLPVMYYDWDKGIFRQDTNTVMKMIAHIDHDVNGDKKRNEIFQDMKAQSHISKRMLTKVSNPELAAVGNGVFNRKTKELIPYDPDRFCFTQQIATNYTNATVEPVFGPNNWSLYKWLHDDVAKGDEDMFYTLKQVIFAAVTGDIRASKFAMFYDDGEGSTGKSTFMEFIENLVGKANCKPVDFTSKDIGNVLYTAYGAQVLIFDDPSVGGNKKISNTGILKKLVSNQDVGIYQKYHDKFSTKMNAFLLMAVNGLPHFEEMDAAIAKRMLPIKFTKAFDRNNPADQKVEDEYISNPRLLEFVLNDVLNNVSLDDGYKLQKDTDEIIKESFAEYDPFISFNEDVLQYWLVPYMPGSLAFSTFKNYAVASNFDRSSIGSNIRFYKNVQKAGWLKQHRGVPTRSASPEMFLSSCYDKTPLKTDLTIADYEAIYAAVGENIDQFAVSAARLSNGVDVYGKAGSNSHDYSKPAYLSAVSPTTLIMNPKTKKIVDGYMDERDKEEKRYKEIEKVIIEINGEIKRSSGSDIPDLSYLPLDELHQKLMDMEKYIKDNPEECPGLTSHYDEIMRKYKEKQAKKDAMIKQAHELTETRATNRIMQSKVDYRGKQFKNNENDQKDEQEDNVQGDNQ